MLILNFFQTFNTEFESFINDIKLFFTNIFKNIYNFFNQYMSSDIMILFGIAILAFLAILLFRYILNK